MSKKTIEDAIAVLYTTHQDHRREIAAQRRSPDSLVSDAHLVRRIETAAYWQKLLGHMRATFPLLQARSHHTLGAPIPPSTQRCESLEYQVNVIRFLRTLAQAAELSVDICVMTVRCPELFSAGREELSTFLEHLRRPVWAICADLEPRLFWATDPFWAGLSDDHVRDIAWKIYARLYMLACFDRVQMLQNPPPPEDGEYDSLPIYHPHHHNRPVARPAHLGIREDATAPAPTTADGDVTWEMYECDMERWPMSVLFMTIDMVSEAWERTRYSPRNVRFLARALLRYATLGYAKTPLGVATAAQADGYRHAHDEEQYCLAGDTHIAVDPDQYYTVGGAALRDVLRDLCAVALADTAIAPLTNPRTAPGRWADAPLTKRLFDALGTYLTGNNNTIEDEDLMDRCKNDPSIGVLAADLSSVPRMRELSERCFASFTEFLDGSEARSVEEALIKSGVACILQPGEVYKFYKRWEDYGVTPINVVNGLRPRDMQQYGDHIMSGTGVGRIFECKRGGAAGLPKCLSPLIDYMGWETARNMMRMMAIEESTESFLPFLVDAPQVRSADCWERFRVWAPEDIPEPLETLVAKMNTLVEFPPFPAMLLLRGRVFLWNPYAPHLDAADEDDEDCGIFEAPLLDVTGDAMPMALYVWLRERISLVETLLRGVRAVVKPELQRTGAARLTLYKALLHRWFADPKDVGR